MVENISVFKVQIQDNIFISETIEREEREQITNISNDFKFIYEYMNFDNITVEDFMDYLEFLDTTRCVFIINDFSERFLNIINYIDNYIDNKLIIYNYKEKNFLLHSLDFDFSLTYLSFKTSINMYERLNNSYNAINSSIYDLKEPIHIKHIVVDNLETINKLNPTIMLNSGMNSLIIVENGFNSLENVKTFSKVLSNKQILNNVQSKNFRKIDIDEEKNRVEKFYNTGQLSNVDGLPKNLNKYFSGKRLHSLFIKENTIYFDSDYEILLTKEFNTNVYELINKINNLDLSYDDYTDDRFIKNYFIANTIINEWKEPLKFITSINKAAFYTVKETDINSNFEFCIGYKRGNNECYIYNFMKNKTFKVSPLFLIYFEGIIKNIESELISKNLNVAKEMLRNVQ